MKKLKREKCIPFNRNQVSEIDFSYYPGELFTINLFNSLVFYNPFLKKLTLADAQYDLDYEYDCYKFLTSMDHNI